MGLIEYDSLLLKTTSNIAYLIIISKMWCAMPTLLCIVQTKTILCDCATVLYWEHVESVMRHTVYLATFAGHQHRKRNAINDRASYEEWRGGWWTGQMASVVLVTVSGRRRGVPDVVSQATLAGATALAPLQNIHRPSANWQQPHVIDLRVLVGSHCSLSLILVLFNWYDVAAFSQFCHVHFITSIVMGGVKMFNRKLITK